MHALETMHGWGWLLIIAGIFGWSALMLLLSVAILRLPPGRERPVGRSSRPPAQRPR